MRKATLIFLRENNMHVWNASTCLSTIALDAVLKDSYMVYNVLVFAEKETTELQYKTHAELQIKRLKK